MPTVLRLDGARVVIYPADHEPAHVHVRTADGEAVYVLNCPVGPATLRDNKRLSLVETRRLLAQLTPYIAMLCAAWETINDHR